MANCKECGRHFYLLSSDGICDDCKEVAEKKAERQQLAAIIMTTSIDVPGRTIESVISIVAAEVALGMGAVRDVANAWRDFLGGRSNASQKSLKEARTACLEELKREAYAAGADAVIAVDLDYNELTTSGPGGILFIAATGTAVKLIPKDQVADR